MQTNRNYIANYPHKTQDIEISMAHLWSMKNKNKRQALSFTQSSPYSSVKRLYITLHLQHSMECSTISIQINSKNYSHSSMWCRDSLTCRSSDELTQALEGTITGGGGASTDRETVGVWRTVSQSAARLFYSLSLHEWCLLGLMLHCNPREAKWSRHAISNFKQPKTKTK